MILLLTEEEAPSFLRYLPLLAMIGLILFRWLSGKINKKEQEQRAEEEQRRRQEQQEATPSQTRPVQPSQRTQPRSAQQIHRYQPEIPAAPAPPDWRRPQPAESEQIVLAQDITTADALGHRQPSQQQRQHQLRIQAAHRAKALQNQRRQQQAQELRARQDAEKKAAAEQRARDLHDGQIVTAQLVSVPAGVLAPTQITVSRARLRQAVVWAEILGPPRALRTYSFAY